MVNNNIEYSITRHLLENKEEIIASIRQRRLPVVLEPELRDEWIEAATFEVQREVMESLGLNFEEAGEVVTPEYLTKVWGEGWCMWKT